MQQGYLWPSAIGAKTSIGFSRYASACFLSESVLFEQILPCLLIANTTALPQRPALEIADRHIGVETGDSIGVLRRPSVGKQPATAHGLKGHFLGQPFLLRHERIKGIPVLKGTRAAQHVVRIDIRHVITPLEQKDIHFRVIRGETCTPSPRLPHFLFVRQHDKTGFAIHLESHFLKSIPV